MFVLYVEHVADLQAKADAGLGENPGLALPVEEAVDAVHGRVVLQLHVDVVVRLQDVLGVGLAPHAFADVEVGRRELQRTPAGDGGEARREGRRIADGLVVHVLVLGVGTVHVALPGDGVQEREGPRPRPVVRLERCVQAAAERLAVVHHGPCVSAFHGEADDAVLYLVPVDVGLNVY